MVRHAFPRQYRPGRPRQDRPSRAGEGTLARELFPVAEESSLPAFLRGQPGLGAFAVILALLVSTVVLLLRVAGTPPWDTIFNEDLSIFLAGGLSHPWRLLVPYAGYLQLLPRMIGQFAAVLPLRYAAAAFSVIGALVASGCALFVFHASAGHIRSATLRAVLALSIVLLPVAPIELIDNGVDSPWYLMFALLWATLWRPRTWSGVAGAAAIGFLTASSDPIAIVFAPLLAVRIVALRRVREQAVTIGWAAGGLLQLPVIGDASAQHQSRVGRLEPLSHTLAFYAHDVVLPALGWHVAWQLQSLAGRNGATLIVGVVLVAAFAWALITGDRRVRLFVAAALALGFVIAIGSATLTSWVSVLPVTRVWEPGSRYTVVPIFGIYSAAIVAVDAWLRRSRARGVPAQGVAAVVVLVAVLAVGWVTDLRYQASRSDAPVWAPTATRWLAACAHSPAGTITVRPGGGASVTLRCANLRR